MLVTDSKEPNNLAALKKAIREKAEAKDSKGIAKVVRLGVSKEVHMPKVLFIFNSLD